MAWLDEDDLNDTIEVIDYNGNFLGWATLKTCRRLNLPINTIETPKRYLKDPFVLTHIRMAQQRGLLTQPDVNSVQQLLLVSNIVRSHEEEEALRVRFFEESMFVNNKELFDTYQEHKRRTKETELGANVEERIPANVEELLAAFAAFEDDEEDGEKVEAEGWLSSILSDEELGMMED